MARKPKRKSPTPAQRISIARKTGRHCHVCGKRLGKTWHADHVRAHHLGGESVADNYLPSCPECNRLRWHHDSRRIRKILRLGIYMLAEIKKKSGLGKAADRVYRRKSKAAENR